MDMLTPFLAPMDLIPKKRKKVKKDPLYGEYLLARLIVERVIVAQLVLVVVGVKS